MYFESLTALNIAASKVEIFTNDQCQFGYRESVFKKELKGLYMITSVVFRLTKRHQINIEYGAIKALLGDISNPTIADVSGAVIAIRQSKLPDPKLIGNAGSFFKNPVIPQALFQTIITQYPNAPHYPDANGMVKVPAGWMIEQSGWKGKRIGNVGVHALQALVLVNHGQSTGQELLALSKKIKASVFQKFRVEIESEVNLV